MIVDKLPFASPGDPVTAARIDAIRARVANRFGNIRCLWLSLARCNGGGAGHRTPEDRGVLAVLDPRLRTMGMDGGSLRRCRRRRW